MGWSCDHISLHSTVRGTHRWLRSRKHPIGTTDISLLLLTCIQGGCRLRPGSVSCEHFFHYSPLFWLVLMSWHWACTHLWTPWLCDLMWVSAGLIPQYLTICMWDSGLAVGNGKKSDWRGYGTVTERWVLVTASVIISLGWRVPFVLAHLTSFRWKHILHLYLFREELGNLKL